MADELFQVPATISKIQTMADSGLRLWVTTRELKGEEAKKVFDLYNKEGYFVFKPVEVVSTDIENLPDSQLGQGGKKKTPSQQLREALWLFHQAKGGKEEDFPEFYQTQMAIIIDKVRGMI